MPRKKRPRVSAQYQEALDLVVEEGFYVIQKQRSFDGMWSTISNEIHGRKKAIELLEEYKTLDKNRHRWRAVQTIVAEAYTEGWKAHDDFVQGRYEPDGPHQEERDRVVEPERREALRREP